MAQQLFFKYRIRHISGFFKGLWLHSNACMNTVIVWYVSDVWLYSFSTLPYMCASAIINYNCAFGFASKLLLLHLAWCLTTKKKKKNARGEKEMKSPYCTKVNCPLPSEHIHWVSKEDLNTLILKSLLWRPTVDPVEHCIDCTEFHEANLHLIH